MADTPPPLSSTPPVAAAPTPTPAPQAAPKAEDKAATSADPLGALIQDRAGSPGPVASVEAPPAVDPFNYFVQVGAFRGPDEAEAQRARLAMLGFAAQVSEREQAGRPVFRVRLGRRFDAPHDARAFTTELEAHFRAELASPPAP